MSRGQSRLASRASIWPVSSSSRRPGAVAGREPWRDTANMDWNALVLRAGEPVRAFGRLVRNADGDWFEGPVTVSLIMTPVIRAPVHAVPLIGASFAELADRYEHDGAVEGTAIVTGTWTGSALRVEHQAPAAQPDEVTQVFQDRAPRTLRFHWTRREAEEVRNHLGEHWADWTIYSIGIIGDHVEARLARVLPDMAAWMETLPAGILALEPWLTPATQRVGAQEPVP
jgi:hypothetical protein